MRGVLLSRHEVIAKYFMVASPLKKEDIWDGWTTEDVLALRSPQANAQFLFAKPTAPIAAYPAHSTIANWPVQTEVREDRSRSGRGRGGRGGEGGRG